jgi:hypothetical protein
LEFKSFNRNPPGERVSNVNVRSELQRQVSLKWLDEDTSPSDSPPYAIRATLRSFLTKLAGANLQE